MPTILICDDEPTLRELMRVSLGDGYAFAEAADVAEAIELANDVHPDLVLLDVMMPGMDGPETLRRLADSPRTAAIPVVFITARTQTHEVAEYRSMGAVGVIAKPFDPMTLAENVKRLLQNDARDRRP